MVNLSDCLSEDTSSILVRTASFGFFSLFGKTSVCGTEKQVRSRRNPKIRKNNGGCLPVLETVDSKLEACFPDIT